MQVIQNPEDQATPHQQVVRQSLKTSIYSYSKSMPQHMHRRLSQENQAENIFLSVDRKMQVERGAESPSLASDPL
jgi:hypothetical protein